MYTKNLIYYISIFNIESSSWSNLTIVITIQVQWKNYKVYNKIRKTMYILEFEKLFIYRILSWSYVPSLFWKWSNLLLIFQASITPTQVLIIILDFCARWTLLHSSYLCVWKLFCLQWALNSLTSMGNNFNVASLKLFFVRLCFEVWHLYANLVCEYNMLSIGLEIKFGPRAWFTFHFQLKLPIVGIVVMKRGKTWLFAYYWIHIFSYFPIFPSFLFHSLFFPLSTYLLFPQSLTIYLDEIINLRYRRSTPCFLKLNFPALGKTANMTVFQWPCSWPKFEISKLLQLDKYGVCDISMPLSSLFLEFMSIKTST